MSKRGERTAAALTGTLYIVAAPSGGGKTSLVRGVLECTEAVELSVSHTTRAARPGEQEGQDYYFVSVDEFKALIEADIFLEHAKVFDHFYGTSRAAVLSRLQAGIDIILEIDWQGARQVRERMRMPDCQSIYILPPSLDVLRNRLQARGQDSAAVIERRMGDAVDEMRHYDEFDYLIINDDFNRSLEAMRAIFLANRHRCHNQIAREQVLLQNLLP